MSLKDLVFFAAMVALSSMPTLSAQSFDQSSLKLLKEMNRQPNALARYIFLIESRRKLSPNARGLAAQFRSFSENELGLYAQAVFSFPLKSRLPDSTSLPDAAGWRAEDAIDTIIGLATSRRIVMVNEAHHNAHTRELTLALLPKLRALGFNYFAAEALIGTQDTLMQRGYPVKKSGTEYLDEPIYGEIIREATKLGFTVISYDSADQSAQAREDDQARNLYQRVFAKDPRARLFVHGGYAHIDKQVGRLFNFKPMAMQLKKLTGFDPLSIDQTDFLEWGLDPSDAYQDLVKVFPSKKPFVLINRQTGRPWSARPMLYDLNVILPPSLQIQAFGINRLYQDHSDSKQVMIRNTVASLHNGNLDQMIRPKWLELNGLRHGFPIDTSLCRMHIPCVVSAHYSQEPDDAIAADRYAFMEPQSGSKLYLRPGSYRLRAWDVKGNTLYEQNIRVKGP